MGPRTHLSLPEMVSSGLPTLEAPRGQDPGSSLTGLPREPRTVWNIRGAPESAAWSRRRLGGSCRAGGSASPTSGAASLPARLARRGLSETATCRMSPNHWAASGSSTWVTTTGRSPWPGRTRGPAGCCCLLPTPTRLYAPLPRRPGLVQVPRPPRASHLHACAALLPAPLCLLGSSKSCSATHSAPSGAAKGQEADNTKC